MKISTRSLATPIVTLILTAAAVTEKPAPKEVTSAEAAARITQRVEPTVPPLAKVARIGGKVQLRIVISPSGDVAGVKVLEGHPILVPSAVEAVKKWKYKPFSEGNVPIPVTTTVEIEYPGGMSQKESEVRSRYFPVADECRSLLKANKYADAERKCRQAVDISNELPTEVVLERSSARAFLANSIILQGRAGEAIPWYEEALALDKGYLKANDADLASDYANLGRAYGAIGDLAKADSLYSTAVSTFEGAIQNLPSMKENYTRRLKRTLLEYAELKDAQGEGEAAEKLRKKAAAL
jgi:TonB family protein